MAADTPTELLDAFITASREALAFLNTDPAFTLKERVTHRAKEIDRSEIKNDFHAVVEFRTSSGSGRMEFSSGYRDNFTNLVVDRPNPGPLEDRQHGLWAWAEALGRRDGREGGSNNATNVAVVRGSVLALGAKLAELWPTIVAADASQWNAIDALVRAEMKRLTDSRG